MSEKKETSAAVKKLMTTTATTKPTRSVLPHQTPRLRDHYLIGKKLGQGQFGTTYSCTQK
ncbi:hypothetical protein RND81_03G141500 [Saponaria officinalis]|uniref:Uncharacterized protein n=1 Tax=Saponaria officinalis TaxID=3572 RepID=A0AAW1M056_SAPOF